MPKTALPLATARRYCCGDAATVRTKGDHLILDFCSEDEDGADWDDGDGSGWLSSLISLREDLVQGDHRPLYLAWLLCVQQGEVEDDASEPPVPPGLDKLTGSLKTFCDFLRLDPHLVAVATEGSAPSEDAGSDRALKSWVGALPEGEKTEALVCLLQNPKAPVRPELLRRFREGRGRPDAHPEESRRTAGQLLAGAEKRAEGERRRQADRAAQERAKREREAAAAREQHLKGLAKREPELWAKVESLIGTKKPSDYDQAVALLGDLRDLGARNARADEFERRLRALHERHAKKPSSLVRLQKAGLSGTSA